MRHIGALISSMKFLSPEVALYLSKSTTCPCMDYCCHVWAGAPSCYMELLDKLQKQICRTIGPSLATSLEPLVAVNINFIILSMNGAGLHSHVSVLARIFYSCSR